MFPWPDASRLLSIRRRSSSAGESRRWPVSRAWNHARKLYIETVGCQMNLLDSELVVGQLRNEGYELTDDIEPGRHDPVQHLLGPAARRGQDLQCAWAGSGASRSASPSVDRRARLHGPEGPGADPRRAPHVDVVVGPGPARPGPGTARPGQGRRRAADGRQPAAHAGSRESITASFDELRRRSASRPMRPSPFQAFVRVMMGCDKFCTYCIVPSVRGPEQSRPPRRSSKRPGCLPTRGSRKSPCWARPSTATSSASRDGRTTRLSDLLARSTTSPGSSGSSSSPTSPMT